MAGTFAGIEKLYVAILEEPELEALRGIIHFCRDNGIRKVELVGILLINFYQRCSLWEALRDVVVFTADLKHRDRLTKMTN